ncbi:MULTISPECIES: putative quinol monooxygenase [Myroides]|uniref:Antibiotic biosynthesis monooxygenase n=1 Tax=Myroides albus TaxID=2562892 RepID=A0A6I3LHV5_9FLAO|nr:MULTISPECIES: antibiotic biosynthesis monooxygenase family protein [Myroides]MTG97823.1 antibiotic biosynthesis monooxygenase [Myroides albus]MVX37237.1 antibiotic biosynthesis monooxygenase [Myroides sp. LoEW2-1]UVD79780.1 antibiotic biosynthesis monooxygenase [Myroides albus]
MFIRIVKLTFHEDKVEEFVNYFEEIKSVVRNQPGCTFLELYQDKHIKNIFFTYSYWDTEQDLDTYRHSSTFKEVWPFVKTLFSEKAEAWSVDRLVTVK